MITGGFVSPTISSRRGEWVVAALRRAARSAKPADRFRLHKDPASTDAFSLETVVRHPLCSAVTKAELLARSPTEAAAGVEHVVVVDRAGAARALGRHVAAEVPRDDARGAGQTDRRLD